MLDKFQSIFDPTAADFTECDTIGSYLVSSSGEVIDSTDVGGTEGLNVNVLNDITATCDLDGVYNVTTNADPDNVGMIAHDRAAAPSDAEQIFRPTGGQANADAIVAANIHALDTNGFMMGYNGTTWDRITATSGRLDVAIDEPIESVQSGFSSCAYAAVSVGNTATQLVGSALTNRKKVLLQNLGARAVYLGCDASVTTANGIRVPKGGAYEFEWDATVDLHAITSAGTADIRVQEAA